MQETKIEFSKKGAIIGFCAYIVLGLLIYCFI